MPSVNDSSATRPSGSSSRSDQLTYYKAQYEQLEAELSEFQASSRELEAELEKDIEASEKRERQLKERLENLRYEIDDWKSRYKQAKSEASAAQNTLQKEITKLRDGNRTLQLKLRDIEVANDDYERQARHTTSSLEDLEQKYNMAIERSVLLEEEVKNGEMERESLRIENQRLRDELSEQRVEAEILSEKLRHEQNGGRRRKPASLIYRTPSTPQTPEIFDRTLGAPTVSSPMFQTPPIKNALMTVAATPPSPPMSEASVTVPTSMRKTASATPGFPFKKAGGGAQLGSRSMYDSKKTPKKTRGSTFTANNTRPNATTLPFASAFQPGGISTNDPTSSASISNDRSTTLPKSGSLYQIRGLIGKMQQLEERVHSAKSKLPAPSDSPSRVSSRSGSIVGDSPVSSTITMRQNSARKRVSGSSFSSSVREGDTASSYNTRPSFGTRTQGDSRPSSRTSYSSSFSQSTHPSVAPSNHSARPESRQSRTKTPLGHFSTNPTTESRRPRSSLSNPSVQNGQVNGMSNIDEDEDLAFKMSVRAKISEAREMRFPSFSPSFSSSFSSSFSTPINPSTPTNPVKTVKKRTPSGIPAPPRSFRTSTNSQPKSNVGDLGETF